MSKKRNTPTEERQAQEQETNEMLLARMLCRPRSIWQTPRTAAPARINSKMCLGCWVRTWQTRISTTAKISIPSLQCDGGSRI